MTQLPILICVGDMETWPCVCGRPGALGRKDVSKFAVRPSGHRGGSVPGEGGWSRVHSGRAARPAVQVSGSGTSKVWEVFSPCEVCFQIFGLTFSGAVRTGGRRSCNVCLWRVWVVTGVLPGPWAQVTSSSHVGTGFMLWPGLWGDLFVGTF